MSEIIRIKDFDESQLTGSIGAVIKYLQKVEKQLGDEGYDDIELFWDCDDEGDCSLLCCARDKNYGKKLEDKIKTLEHKLMKLEVENQILKSGCQSC